MKKILSILSVSMILLSCNTGQSSHGVKDPKEVLTRFFKALSEKNIPEAKKYVTADSEGMINMMQMSFQNMEAHPEDDDQFDINRVNISDAVVSGDVATVKVTEKRSGEATNFTLKKEEGEWKVAFDMGTLFNMATERMQKDGMKWDEEDSLLKDLSEEDVQRFNKYKDTLQSLLDNVSEEQLQQANDFLESNPGLNKSNAGEMIEQLKKLKKNNN